MAWLYVVVLCFQDVGPGPAVVVPGTTHCVRKVGGNRVALWHGFMWLSCLQGVGPGPAVVVPDSTQYRRREVVSNWSRYEERETETHKPAEFSTLINTSGTYLPTHLTVSSLNANVPF